MLILLDGTIVAISKSQLSTFIRYANHKGEPQERFFFSLIQMQIGLLKPYLTMLCTIKEFTFTAKLVRHMMVQLSWWATYLACRNKFQECIHSLPSIILKSHIKSNCKKLFVLSKKAIYTHFYIFSKTCWPFIISLITTVHSCPSRICGKKYQQ